MEKFASDRNWFQIHGSTIWVGAFVVLVVICLVCPGEGHTGYASGHFTAGGSVHGSWNTYIHGWPWIFLDRTAYEEPPLEISFESQIPWLTPSCWFLSRGDQFEFGAIALAGDILVALAIPSVVVTLFEIRRRKRRSIWQVRLVDMFVLFLVISCVLAWWKVEQDEVMSQEKHRSAIEQRGHRALGGGYGPVWIRRLTGMELGILPGIDEVEFQCSEDELSAILPHLKSLRTLRTIRIIDTFPSAMKSLPLSQLRSLKKLHVVNLSFTVVNDSIIPELIELPQLERIDLQGTEVSSHGVARLQELLPHCEIILPGG